MLLHSEIFKEIFCLSVANTLSICHHYRTEDFIFEPAHEERDLMMVRVVVFQKRMRSTLFELQTCGFAW